MRFGKIKLFVIILAIVAPLSVTAGSERRQERGEVAAGSAFHIAPYLQNASQDGITVMWETKQPSSSRVEYWQLNEAKQPEQTAADDSQVRVHRVRITGLKRERHYGYRVRCGKELREADFFTAPAGSRSIRFAIFGDSRFWKDYWQTTGLPQHLLSRKPEFTLHMGDLVGSGLKYKDWPPHFARFASVSSRVPMFPARGNHEGSTSKPEKDWFARYHELPGGEPYSSFDWGNSHFCIVSYTHVSKCASFLDADLGATKKKWKFVAFHYPVYCTGYESTTDKRKVSGNRKLEAVFDKHGVDMVFNGHTHIYERSFPIRGGKRDDRNGTVYLVQGGAVGGNYPDWWTATIARDMSLPHYSLLEVGDDTIELRSYGLARGDQKKGKAARIIEVDHYVRWRNEAVPRGILAGLSEKTGPDLLDAIENLGAMCYGPAAEVLVGYLSDSNAAIRRAAALALERTASAAVSERLAPFLRDADVLVRRHVARALEAAMLPEVGEKIVPEILDLAQDSEVRCRLLGALLHHDRDHALRAAMIAEKASDKTVRRRAADVIKRTSPPAGTWNWKK